MKERAFIYGLSAAMLLASLTACGTSQADQPTEPDPTPTPSAVQTQPVETPEPEETTSPVEPMRAYISMSEEDLTDYFEVAYNSGQIFESMGAEKEEVLQAELDDLALIREINDHLAWPDDLEAKYLTWRVLNHSQEPEAEAPSSNPQTSNNQTQPVNAQTGGTTTTTQTGPGGATIVYDPSSDAQNAGFKDESLANGGTRFDADTAKNWEEMGYSAPSDPEDFIYGGGN